MESHIISRGERVDLIYQSDTKELPERSCCYQSMIDDNRSDTHGFRACLKRGHVRMIERPIVKIASKTWLISDYKLDNFFLLEGEERSLLIDTGAGLGPVGEIVRGLSQKTLLIAATHGHGDHIGGSCLFDVPTYLHKDDMSFVDSEGRIHMKENDREENGFRRFYASSRGKMRNPEASEEELLELVCEDRPAKFLPMEDGTVFELGGRPVEVIHTPGHSQGSVCFLDKKERLLFTGDTANECLLLNFWPSTASVAVYQNSVKRLWSREGEYDAICQGHGRLGLADKSFLKDYLEAAEMLLSGRIQGIQMNDGLHQGLGIHYNKICIFYDPEHLT